MKNKNTNNEGNIIRLMYIMHSGLGFVLKAGEIADEVSLM